MLGLASAALWFEGHLRPTMHTWVQVLYGEGLDSSAFWFLAFFIIEWKKTAK